MMKKSTGFAARTLIALAVAGAFPMHAAMAEEAAAANAATAATVSGVAAEAASDPAAAGQDASAPAAAPAKGEAGQLATVIVTAQRRSENIKDVPMAISTLSGDKLDVLTSGAADIRFLAGRTPSVNVESDYGRTFPRFYIRGLGNIDFDLNSAQPVGLVVDDVIQENAMLKGFPVFDTDQIEVARGPQGTLFGRGVAAEQRALRAARHFDLVGVEDREAFQHGVFLDHVIDHQTDRLRRVQVEVDIAQAANVEAREGAAVVRLDVHGRRAAGQEADVGGAGGEHVELVAAQGRDRHRHIFDVFRAALGRHDDGGQLAGFAFGRSGCRCAGVLPGRGRVACRLGGDAADGGGRGRVGGGGLFSHRRVHRERSRHGQRDQCARSETSTFLHHEPTPLGERLFEFSNTTLLVLYVSSKHLQRSDGAPILCHSRAWILCNLQSKGHSSMKKNDRKLLAGRFNSYDKGINREIKSYLSYISGLRHSGGRPCRKLLPIRSFLY